MLSHEVRVKNADLPVGRGRQLRPTCRRRGMLGSKEGANRLESSVLLLLSSSFQGLSVFLTKETEKGFDRERGEHKEGQPQRERETDGYTPVLIKETGMGEVDI